MLNILGILIVAVLNLVLLQIIDSSLAITWKLPNIGSHFPMLGISSLVVHMAVPFCVTSKKIFLYD